jgi:SAM-dependent methyltransferase
MGSHLSEETRKALDEVEAIAAKQVAALNVEQRTFALEDLPRYGRDLPAELAPERRAELAARVEELQPWLQGPFYLGGDLVVEGRWRNDYRWDAIGEIVGDLAGKRVLDIGSNAGFDPFTFVLRGAKEVVACEPFEFVEQLRFLESIYQTGVQVEQIGWQELDPAVHGTFDLVHCNGVLYHEPNPMGMTARLAEMVAPGGRMLLGTMVLDRPDLAEYARFVRGEYAGDPTWWWVPGRVAMRQMLEACGLDAAPLEPTFFPGPRGSFPVLNGYFEATPIPPDRFIGAVSDTRVAPIAAKPQGPWPGAPGSGARPHGAPVVGAFEPRAVSEALVAFVEELPWERESIAAFVQAVARTVPPGARVLDVGAGDAPYRELFAHADYRTTEWEESPHEGAVRADVVGSADALPLDDASVDVVLLTQVLEHVPQPRAVLAELRRVLKPGGWVHLTAPLVWEVHEAPYDFFRYTGYGLQALLEDAGFAEVEVAPRNGALTTLAQLLADAGSIIGRSAPDGLDEQREAVGAALAALAEPLARLEPLDARRVFPLGYRASAIRPGA